MLSRSFIVGRSTNRSYGARLDNVLDRYGAKDTIFSYEGAHLSLNLFKMLLPDRIDALPGLPEEAMYPAETHGLDNRIMTLAVEENIQDHEAMLTYVVYSKSQWGREVIEKINRVLREQRPTTRYRAAYERRLDERSITPYRKMYKEIFLKQVD